MSSFIDFFDSLPDPRVERTRKHELIDILVITIAAVLSGCDDCNEIELYGNSREEWLKTFLEVPEGIPSYDTFNRVFAMLDPEELQKRFLSWVQSVATITDERVVSIDGKRLCACGKDGSKSIIDMVSAWSNANNMVLDLFYSAFDVQEDCSIDELEKAATTSVALDKLLKQYKLGSMAYDYKGTGNQENEDAIASIILGNSLLTANSVPVAGEYETKNVQAMKIMDTFGTPDSFTEYYAMDFKEDVVLMGHDGPGHIAIAEGKTKVRPIGVYHGKVGKCLSVEMSVKNGPVTLLSVVEKKGGGLIFLVAEGESVPGAILQIGNTNSRYRFSIGARKFVNDWNGYGPAHHCAVGVGHISSKIEKVGALLNMDVVKVC